LDLNERISLLDFKIKKARNLLMDFIFGLARIAPQVLKNEMARI
jgi:hypothetical protein